MEREEVGGDFLFMIALKREMPENGNACPCQSDYVTCWADEEDRDVPLYGRPDWCPWVEIVRCKDCDFRLETDDGEGICPKLASLFVEDDFFCADGKRREEA